MDTNGDGKLEYKEFVENAYEMYKEFAKFETEDEGVPMAQLLFAELDKDKDRSLVADELRPILHYLQPGELSYAKYYSTFLCHEVSLSLPKMLINPFFEFLTYNFHFIIKIYRLINIENEFIF